MMGKSPVIGFHLVVAKIIIMVLLLFPGLVLADELPKTSNVPGGVVVLNTDKA